MIKKIHENDEDEENVLHFAGFLINKKFKK
jgi:hypothetical protein